MAKNNPPSDQNPTLIVDDPYLFEQCQVDIHLALFPQEAAVTRQAALSITSHGDAPTFQVYQDADVLIENLAAEVRALLTRFKAELPERHLSRLRRTAEEKSRKKAKPPTPAAPAEQPVDGEGEVKVTAKKQLTLLGA